MHPLPRTFGAVITLARTHWLALGAMFAVAGCQRTAGRPATPVTTTTVTITDEVRPDAPMPAEPTDPCRDASAAASNDDQTRVVIARAVAILREVGGLIRAHRDDCDDMAAALRDFAARHDALLRAHRRRALAIPADCRAALMRQQLGSTVDLDDAVNALDSCRGHAGVSAVLARLQMF